jgi:hypothetical protein
MRETLAPRGTVLIVRRWLLLMLAVFGVSAAIAVPLLTGGGKETQSAGQRQTYSMYAPATAHLTKACYHGSCYTKAQALRLCKKGQGLKHLCDAWGIKQAAKH